VSHTNAEILGAASIAFSRFATMADRWWPKVTSSRASGTLIYNTYQLTLATTVSGGTIYYSTDGSVPTNINSQYVDGITLSSGKTIITARVYKDGKYSPPAAWSYNLVSLAPSEEHISIGNITAIGTLTPITYRDAKAEEHISITGITAVGDLIWGLTSSPVSAANIDDGSGDWGKAVTVTLDHPVHDTAGNAGAFVLTDANSVTFTAQTIVASADGKTLTLGFINFNNAAGACSLGYTPGTVQSPAVAMSSWSITFTPTGLIPTSSAPIVTEVTNI
jgi:hypothetical protein